MSILVQTKAGSSCPPLLREKRPRVSSLHLLICRGDWVGWEPQGGTVAMRHPTSHGCSPWSEMERSLCSCSEVFFQHLVACAGCKRGCVAARSGLCLCQKHTLSLAGELSSDRNQVYFYHLWSSPVREIIIAIGRSWVSPGGKPEVLGSWGFSWCGKSLGGNNPVCWAVCHPCCRHPGTLLGVAPSVICLQILQSHHRYGARCDGKGLRRLPGNLPALIPLSLHISGSAPVCSLRELLEFSSALAREASSLGFPNTDSISGTSPCREFSFPNGRM